MKIAAIQKELIDSFVLIIGNIISFSPRELREFLKVFLIKYEILNLKKVIQSILVGENIKDRHRKINMLVEKYLDNKILFQDLLKSSSPEEVQILTNKTIYHQAIIEGLLHFKNNNEIFYLLSFLDRVYFEIIGRNRIKTKRGFFGSNSKLKASLQDYFGLLIELYNIKILMKNLAYDLPVNLVKQLIFDDYFILNQKMLTSLVKVEAHDEFHNQLQENYKRSGNPYIFNFDITQLNQSEIYQKIKRNYFNRFFKKFRIQDDLFSYSCFNRVVRFLVRKENEIRDVILPAITRILHQNLEKGKLVR